MKKIVNLALYMFLISIGACTMVNPEPIKGLIKPGDKIGEMTVEQSTEIPYQNIWQFCDQLPDEHEPVSFTSDCDVPLVSSLDIDFGWFAKRNKICTQLGCNDMGVVH